MQRFHTPAWLTPVILAVALLAAACSGETEEKASGGSAPSAETVSGTVTVVGTDNKFAPANLTVKAGEPLTVLFENKGAAIHNWHVLNAKSSDGKEITTQLLPGSKSETITFTIDKPGVYDVYCDVHPVDMHGKLTVQ